MATTEQKLKVREARFQKLIEDLKKIIEEENLSTIKIKHKIGARILLEKENIPHGEIFPYFKELAEKLDYSWRELYYCTEFAHKYPSLEEALNEFDTKCQKLGINLTWKLIRNQILGEKLEEATEKQPWLCNLCAHEFLDETQTKISLCPICYAEFEVWRHERMEKPT